MKKDVSIILVNYKTEQLTKDCLNSIFEKTSGIDFDVYVVDNASEDNTPEMIKRDFPQVKLIENKENLGFGRANNCAIRESDSKYVFLLNTDTILVNNAVKILFDYMEQNQNVGASGGNLYDDEMNPIHSYGIFPTLEIMLLKAFGLRLNIFPEYKRSKDSGRNKNNEHKPVDYITGADLMLRNEVLDKVGIFNDDFFMYFEETELQFRIRKAGYEIMILPEAKIIHLHNKSPKRKTKMYYEYLKNKYLFMKLSYGTKKNLGFIKALIFSQTFLKIFTYRESILKLYKFMFQDQLNEEQENA